MRHIFESSNSGSNLPDDPFHPFTSDEWETHTATLMRAYLLQHVSNLLDSIQSLLGPYPHPDLQAIQEQP